MKQPSTIWLLLLVVATHMGYEHAPNRWAAFASGLGAMTAVLLWAQRGQMAWVRWWRIYRPKADARWWLCLWGSFEGWQVFACQGAQNWWRGEAPPYEGMCGVFTGWPLYGAGAWCAALIAVKVATEIKNG